MKCSDNSQQADEPHVAGVLDLEVGDVEILFQVAHQLANYDEARLAALGCPAADLEKLIDGLRVLRHRVGDSSKVRVFVIERLLCEEGAGGSGSIGAEVMENDAITLRTELPIAAAKFPELMQFVISSIGPRELFLRTGFHLEELKSLMAKFEGRLSR
ncbi:hypothetical protein LDL08_16755 [Nonomuraea glycinis]|uniref:Uncharacterized protein n=1 Tax=Nonomuraea glycinis TaxID=2047744 RepID=A0A918A5I0_9ACTN|nr:hypothetical protein [Nonomuraea glycinis]MCA2177842.1 hypothetical protein [Nonomuraea glycinis]GGP06584.1 hypothetical protein GCM10012278_30790 [Nonomuraea glycinis]